jgi:hypothetical protein
LFFGAWEISSDYKHGNGDTLEIANLLEIQRVSVDPLRDSGNHDQF